MTSAPHPARARTGILAHLPLLVLLWGVSLFEGFDVNLTGVVLPYLGEEFDASSETLGRILSVTAFGAILSVGLIRLADCYGRRPILLLAVAGFSLGSLATAFTTSLAGFTIVQFLTRIFLVTQIALAYLIFSETLPPAIRGRANGFLGAAGSFGAALPFLALGPALAMPTGWRTLYIIGALPLLLLPLLWRKIHETPIWHAARREGAPRLTIWQELHALTRPDQRRAFFGVSALWFLINFASATTGFFFTLYVVSERGWAPIAFAKIAPISLVGALLGYVLAGVLADLIGRRRTVAFYFAAFAAFSTLCYASTGAVAITAGFLGLQAMLGVWSVGYTLNSELFPTHLRAAANGWCLNLLGRIGMVVSPALVGALATRFSSLGGAVILCATLAAAVAIPLVLFLPETKARRLDQV